MTMLGAALLLASPSLPVLSVAMLDDEVTQPSSGQEARALSLVWPSDVKLVLETSPYEVVVRFDRPIKDAMLQAFAKDAGADLADLRWNDNSLVIRAASGRRIDASAQGRTLIVHFLPESQDVAAPSLTPSPATPASDTELELEIARAEADAAAGYPDRARRRLVPLAERYPDNKRIQRLLGDMEVAEGALVLGATRYREIAADDPFARQAMAEAGGNIMAAGTIRGGKVFSQVEGGLNALVPVGRNLAVGAGVRHVRSKADTVLGPTGILTDVVAHTTIADALATVQIGNTSRLELQGSAQVDEKVYGVGARLFAGAPERQARVLLAYRLPDVATPEQSTFGGHISRAGIGGTIRLTPELVLQADGGWNGYGLRGTGVRTRSIAVSGGIDYLFRRSSPSLAITYRLDAEYVNRTRLRPNGLPFIPLSDRENHSFQLVAGKSWTKWQVTGAAGWTFDRIGNTDGPTANISATGRLNDGWRLQASGGVSSISRPGISGRQLYLRVALTRYLGRF
ncbi:MAG TPA: hypothetical protein VJ762_13370 [Sphingobium sp.]|nr:hypothetical protein [Sphingobium sp.]